MSVWGIVEEQVDAVELDAVDLGLGRQVEHLVEEDVRFRAAHALLADEPGPHGVVQFGIVIGGHTLGWD